MTRSHRSARNGGATRPRHRIARAVCGAIRALRDAGSRPDPRRRIATKSSHTVTLIGLDVSRTPVRLRTRSWMPLVAAGLAGALLLAVLRVDVIRTRFGLAESVAEELRLEDLKRELTVDMRRLRDPAVLSRRARELGFGLAEHLIHLPTQRAPTPRLESDSYLGDPIEIAAAERGLHGARP